MLAGSTLAALHAPLTLRPCCAGSDLDGARVLLRKGAFDGLRDSIRQAPLALCSALHRAALSTF